MLFRLSYVRLVDKVAGHCDGVLQVLHLVRAASRHKEKAAGRQLNTERFQTCKFFEILVESLFLADSVQV